jgi:hypothetical protein
VAMAVMLGGLSTFLLAPLNPNIRYEIGVKSVSVSSASETFTHRPLAYRLLMDRIAYVADALSFGITSFEVVVRLIGLGLAVGTAVLLWRGLKSHGVVAPGLHAGVAAAALVFMGANSSVEPDWMATLLATAGIGAALIGRGRLRWPMAFLAGTLFVAAAAMKVITLPTALVGLLVVGVLDRRQLLRSLISSVVVGLLFVVATLIWAPWEITWLIDIRLLQPSVLASLSEVPAFLLESAARWPAVALFPAAMILAGRTERLVLAAAALLAAAPIVLQGQYWSYHAAPLCVVTAVAVFRGLRWRVGTRTGIGVLVIVVAAIAFTITSNSWRDSHLPIWGGATIAASVLGIGWALAVRQRPVTNQPLGLLPAALTTIVLLYPAMTPFSAGLVQLTDNGMPTVGRGIGVPVRQEEDTARQIRRRIGENVPVTYLTFGDWTYFIGNPTVCRYPSPLFLQRTKYTVAHVGTRSYQENLACIDEPTSQWLIVDRGWFKLSKAPPELKTRVAAEWNCSASFSAGGLIICPRRA